MLDAKIFAACASDRSAYEKVKAHIDTGEMSPEGSMWWPYLAEWYELDPTTESVDMPMLRDRGKRGMPRDHLDTLLDWYDNLPTRVSANNVVTELLDLRRLQRGLELQHAISRGDKGERLAEQAEQFAAALRASSLDTGDTKLTTMDSMLETMDSSNRIAVRPAALNKRIGGGLVPGDFVLVFARPEQGKTLFVLNMACGFANDGHKTLYVGNEENTDKTLMRMACCMLGTTEDKVKASPERAREVLKKRGMDNLLVYHMTPGTVHEIEALVQEHQPKVLIVDQIRNITGPGKLTQNLEENGGKFRAMLAKYEMAGVFVTQAGDKTERHGQEPPPWLTMGDIDSSRTGLPGHADLIVGIGADSGMIESNTRAISLPKNKLGNTHTGFTIAVDTVRSRIG